MLEAVKLHRVFHEYEYSDALKYADSLKGNVAIDFVKFKD